MIGCQLSVVSKIPVGGCALSLGMSVDLCLASMGILCAKRA